jgi:hypothetical protein
LSLVESLRKLFGAFFAVEMAVDKIVAAVTQKEYELRRLFQHVDDPNGSYCRSASRAAKLVTVVSKALSAPSSTTPTGALYSTRRPTTGSKRRKKLAPV